MSQGGTNLFLKDTDALLAANSDAFIPSQKAVKTYADIVQRKPGVSGTVGGTANAITLTPSVALTAYGVNDFRIFIPTASNTGAVTVAISGLATRAIKKFIQGSVVDVTDGDILINKPCMLWDDGTQYICLNPQTWAVSANVASATTTDLTVCTGNSVTITGNTQITSITMNLGDTKIVKFSGALTLKTSGSGGNLTGVGGADIVTVAGDWAIVHCRNVNSGVEFLFYSRGTYAANSYYGVNSATAGLPASFAAAASTLCGRGASGNVAACTLGTSLAFTAAALNTVNATQANQETGTDTTTLVTSGLQQNHPSAAKVWAQVTVSAGTPTLGVSYNMTSITDTATGELTLTIATDFSSANYQVACSAELTATTYAVANDRKTYVRSSTAAAGTLILDCIDSTAVTMLLADPKTWYFQAHGDQ